MSLVARHIQYVRGTCYVYAMTHRDQLSDYWSATMSRRFWLIASLFYAGALLTNLAFVLGDNCGFAFILAQGGHRRGRHPTSTVAAL